MTLTTNPYKFFGVSVKGPRHSRDHLRNQDAWYGHRHLTTTLVVICDGLGSRPQSDVGARIGCLAVRDALKIWAASQDPVAENLFRLIKLIWEIRLAPHPPAEFATTCLFAATLTNQRVLVAGLGDGIAAIRYPTQKIEVVSNRATDFTNHTLALGEPHKLTDWKYHMLDQMNTGTAVLLATDGIADDLRLDQLDGFINWLIEQFGPLSPIERYHTLRSELANWPTPKHQDDKTIAMLYC